MAFIPLTAALDDGSRYEFDGIVVGIYSAL